MTSDDVQLLSVREASSRLAISVFTLREWLRQGRLPYIRLGRRVLLRHADVEEVVVQHLVAAIPQAERRS